VNLDDAVGRKWERRRAELTRPPWQELAAFEREERALADIPPEDDTVRFADWQDDLVDREDRTLTGDLPVGYDPRCFGGVDG
jgi:hypothetical protein